MFNFYFLLLFKLFPPPSGAAAENPKVVKWQIKTPLITVSTEVFLSNYRSFYEAATRNMNRSIFSVGGETTATSERLQCYSDRARRHETLCRKRRTRRSVSNKESESLNCNHSELCPGARWTWCWTSFHSQRARHCATPHRHSDEYNGKQLCSLPQTSGFKMQMGRLMGKKHTKENTNEERQDNKLS